MGKAKLAPMSVHTIPRLELGAAVLAVEIAKLVASELDINPDSLKFYTDSKVVLGYIYNETRRFYLYISNRVERIRKSTCPEQLHYVHTSQNPEDVATRSVPAARLSDTNWLTSPDYLAHSVETDKAEETSYDPFSVLWPLSSTSFSPLGLIMIATKKIAMVSITVGSLTQLIHCHKQRLSSLDVYKRRHTKLGCPV